MGPNLTMKMSPWFLCHCAYVMNGRPHTAKALPMNGIPRGPRKSTFVIVFVVGRSRSSIIQPIIRNFFLLRYTHLLTISFLPITLVRLILRTLNRPLNSHQIILSFLWLYFLISTTQSLEKFPCFSWKIAWKMLDFYLPARNLGSIFLCNV